MPSYADVTTSLMELTPCQVFWTPPGQDYTTGEVDLGGTLDNVTIKAKYFKAEIKADQSADTIRDRRTAGVEVTVATALVQTKDKDLWKIVFPHATEITGGTKAIDFVQSVGDSDLDNAGRLRLHPLSAVSGDITRDVVFFKACASADSEILFSPKDQQKLPITWNILPDETTTPEQFFRYGDINL